MKRFLDQFILGIPVLFIKQYPYAWLAFVALWSWPPNLAIVFLAIVLLGVFSLRWREAAWVSTLRREYDPRNLGLRVERLAVPLQHSARNIALLLVISGVVSALFHEQVGLGLWQFFVMLVGFALFYMDTRFFGAVTIHAVTASGIAIYHVTGHLDYRIFLPFKEIRSVRPTVFQPNDQWMVIARTRTPKHGLLIRPRNPAGFSKR